MLGAIYDPPFVHATLQLAEEYDWPGLEAALTAVSDDFSGFRHPDRRSTRIHGPQLDHRGRAIPGRTAREVPRCRLGGFDPLCKRARGPVLRTRPLGATPRGAHQS